MAIDATSPRTRRAILMGALGGVAATMATAVGRASPAAATATYLELGRFNSYPGGTRLTDTATDGGGLEVFANGAGTGITGQSTSGYGVWASSDSGSGLRGGSNSGPGVKADSSSSYGVVAGTNASSLPAVLGHATGIGNGTGVQGFSGDTPPASPVQTGVYGVATQDAASRGVTGESTKGRGVNGIATSGTGVFGKGTSGEGIRGVSDNSNGTAGSSASLIASGVYGENTGGGFGTYGRSNVGSAGSGVFGESTAGTGVAGATTTGVAMRATSSGSGLAFTAQGRVAFSTAGLASVAVGTASKTIKPGTDLVAGSLVLCTLESGQPHLAIQRVTKNITANTFTVFLSAAVMAGNAAKVGWFVIG